MSEIKVDTLTGKTTANDITVTVGATATQSLEQGLAKCWAYIDQSSTGHPASDSLNVTSTADSGSGVTTVSFVNNMGNAYYNTGITTNGGEGHVYGDVARYITSKFDTANTNSSGTGADYAWCLTSNHGDLA